MKKAKKNIHRRKSPEGGFTLVEMAIALIVITILAAVAVPVVNDTLPRYRLRSAARDIYSMTQRARINAVRDNTQWRIVFNNRNDGNTANDTVQLLSAGANGVWGDADDTATPATSLTGYGSGVSYFDQAQYGAVPVDWNNTAVTAGINSVANFTFTSRGFSAAVTTDSVMLQNQDNSILFAITVNIGGAIKMRMYDGSPSAAPASDWID